MSKSKREYNNTHYPRPLPVPIPLLHISNKYYTPWEVLQSVGDTLSHLRHWWPSSTPVTVLYDKNDLSFKVYSPEQMKFIWANGFYGKGILSRSEPTWLHRMENRLKSKHTNDVSYSEEVTSQRRQLRDAWKKQRQEYLSLEKSLKLNAVNGELSNSEKILLDKERDKLTQLKDSINKPVQKSGNLKPIWRMEDFELTDGNGIKDLEYLQLDPVEVLFLLLLQTIEIPNYDFHSLFLELVEEYGDSIITNFVVYYHYKSLGWCVKPGLKFSCDWVLYSRGPPFSHAEFSIKVVNDDEEDTLIDYSAISRVVSGVKKSLVLCFVDQVHNGWKEYRDTKDIWKFLSNWRINEVVWKRWAPSRTRM